jgi:SPP1 gp7 family putative phage head morphogenesis protein
MCKTSIYKTAREDAHNALNETSKPFRTPEQRSRAREFIRNVIDVLWHWQRDFWDIAREMAEDRGQTMPMFYTVARKRAYPEDFEALSALFNVATPEELRALAALFESYGLQMAEVFGAELAKTYQQGLELAYQDIKQHARPQRPAAFGQIIAEYPFDPNSPFYRAFIDKGLELVRDKFMVQMKGEIYKRLAAAIRGELNWSEMATDLYNRFGTGKTGRYQWTRIVRTEMGFAYEYSQYERYDDAGMQYVRRSLANSACPICKGLSGVWKVDEAPRLIVHPNCRCRYIPFYRLPANATLRSRADLDPSLAPIAARE